MFQLHIMDDIKRVRIRAIDTRSFYCMHVELPDGKLEYCEIPYILSRHLITRANKYSEETLEPFPFLGLWLEAEPLPTPQGYRKWKIADDQ